MSERIFLSPPHMDGRERDRLLDAFASNWIAPVGPHLDAFEAAFAVRTETAAALGLSSGTAALHLALQLCGVDRGDTVICPTLTFVATANPIRYLGAEPVFLDSETATWNLDPALLEETLKLRAKQGRLPKAVIVVHLYGQCADIDPILRVCNAFDIPLIEDAAEALGATYKGRSAGSLGRAGIFSFNGNKIITASGGGALVSDDQNFIARARHLATQARDAAPHYQHSEIGFNYRLSNLLAAVAHGQLDVLEARVAARRRVFENYEESLGGLPGLDFMPEAEFGRSNRWLTCLTIDPRVAGVTREDVRLALDAVNVEARPVWKPLHLQPVYAGAEFVGSGVAEKLFDDGLCLPSGSALTPEQQGFVCGVIKDVFSRSS